MGQGPSKSSSTPTKPTPPPRYFTSKPWMEIKSFDKSTREKLREEVASLAPYKCDRAEVPFINILLSGQIKSGKSSLFNSIYSVFANRVIMNKAEVGEAAESLTEELRVYEVKTHPRAAPLPWRIIDTMGLDTETGEVDVRNLLKAVDGHVPDKHVFIKGRDYFFGCPGFVAIPTVAQQAHCVAVVVDASQVVHMAPDMKNQLKSLNQGLYSRGVPTYIILTHIDEACEMVQRDVEKVIKSLKIQEIVKDMHTVLNLPENQIIPVKNYRSELELQNNMDILLLYALRHMLRSAQEHIGKKNN